MPCKWTCALILLTVLDIWPRSSALKVRRVPAVRMGLFDRNALSSIERHDEDTLRKHGSIQWRSPDSIRRLPLSSGKGPVPLRLGLSGDRLMVLSGMTPEKGDADDLCGLPPLLRKYPRKALTMGHTLLSSIDLLLSDALRDGPASLRPGQVVVVVGLPATARVLVSLLALKGFEVAVVVSSEDDAKVARALGATSVLGNKDQPFCEAFPDAVAFVDALGDMAPRSLEPAVRDRYFSVVTMAVAEAVETGAIAAFANRLPKKDRGITLLNTWRPLERTRQEIEGCLALLASGGERAVSDRLAILPSELNGLTDYMQAFTWPMDLDSGLRFGFAASVSRKLEQLDTWGVEDGEDPDAEAGPAAPAPAAPPAPKVKVSPSVAADMLRRKDAEQEVRRRAKARSAPLRTTSVQQEVADALEAEMQRRAQPQGGAPGPAGREAEAQPRAERDHDPLAAKMEALLELDAEDHVVSVGDLADAAELLAGTPGPAVLLVGGKWCRACRYASRQLRKVAPHFPDVHFFEYKAHSKMEPLHSTLGIRAVPAVLFHKDGKVVHTSTTAADQAGIASEVEDWLL